MTIEGEGERPDPLAGVSRATIEVSVLEEDLDRAKRLIDENKWSEDEGLLNVFVTGLYYLLGERRLQAAGSEHDSRAQETESLLKDLMLYQSMYAVMKYRAFTLSEEKYVLEGNVSGLEASDRFSMATIRRFRKDEEMLKSRIGELEEEIAMLRQGLRGEETVIPLRRDDQKTSRRSWWPWKR